MSPSLSRIRRVAALLTLVIASGHLPASATVPPPSSCRLRRDQVFFVGTVSCTIEAHMAVAVVAGMVFDERISCESCETPSSPGATFVGPGVDYSWGYTAILNQAFDVTIGEQYTLTLYSLYGSASVVTDTDAPPTDTIGAAGFLVTYDIHHEPLTGGCTDENLCELVVEGVLGCFARLPLTTDGSAEAGTGYLRLRMESWCQVTPGLLIGNPDVAQPYARHLLTHGNVQFHRPIEVGEPSDSGWGGDTRYGRLFWQIPSNGNWSEFHMCPQALGPLFDGGNNPPPESYPGDDQTCMSLSTPSPGDTQFAAPVVQGEELLGGFAEAPCGGATMPHWWDESGPSGDAGNHGDNDLVKPCAGVWRARGNAFFNPGLAVGTTDDATIEPTGYYPIEDPSDPSGRSSCSFNMTQDTVHANREIQTVECEMFSQRAVVQS
jgi:hypothetical protein